MVKQKWTIFNSIYLLGKVLHFQLCLDATLHEQALSQQKHDLISVWRPLKVISILFTLELLHKHAS